MSCCGSKRAAYVDSLRSRSVATAPVDADAIHRQRRSMSVGTSLRYTGSTSLSMRGPSGRVYVVQAGAEQIDVDIRDAQALLLTMLFVHAQ